jgi:hypothetical protein
MSPLFTEGPEFMSVVRLMRTWEPEFRHLALYASLFWSDARIDDVKTDGPVRSPLDFLN